MYHEHKAPPVAVGADVAEYRRRIRAGNYAVDAEELAASILDSLLPHK
jgi:anti-sigma28 factor (negative regulator of flagellin synthesis)